MTSKLYATSDDDNATSDTSTQMDTGIIPSSVAWSQANTFDTCIKKLTLPQQRSKTYQMTHSNASSFRQDFHRENSKRGTQVIFSK